MSDQEWARLESDTARTVVNVLWRQWRAVGGGASGRPAVGLIDPEVLVLGSLYVTDAEPRLWTVMTDWLLEGSRFLSVQRLRNLRAGFPSGNDRLGELADFVANTARDARWRALRSPKPHTPPERELSSRRRSSELVLDSPATLMLRLRAAFGVGLKADLLTFLLGQRYRATVATAANALGYSTAHVFRGFQDLLVARLVQVTDIPAAAQYSIPFPGWATLLGLEDVPDWRPWKSTAGYALHLLGWVRQRQSQTVTDYAAAAALRELAEQWTAESARAGFADSLPPAPDGANVDDWRKHSKAILNLMTQWA
ncbi:MAG: hypothetical protein IT352_18350 [Gemmatimonadales bacterium]|nr:hypothetical protein [Gemmatimonadales bacterium]